MVLAAGAGALKVRLGEVIPADGTWIPRPTLFATLKLAYNPLYFNAEHAA